MMKGKKNIENENNKKEKPIKSRRLLFYPCPFICPLPVHDAVEITSFPIIRVINPEEMSLHVGVQLKDPLGMNT